MWRYFKLYLYFLRFSISKALEFRFDFFFRILMDSVFYVVNIAFFQVIYRQTNLLAGWNEAEAMVFVAGYLFLDAIVMVVLSSNMWQFPLAVNRGELDYYLTRPVSTLFFMSLREVAMNSVVNLLMTIAIMAWAVSRLGADFSWGGLALYVALLINGAFLHYLVQMVFLIPVFWTHSAEGLRSLFFTTAVLRERPDGLFFGAARVVITTILPYGIMTSFPTRLFVDGFAWSLLAQVVAVTLAYFGVVLVLWRFGLRSYASASS